MSMTDRILFINIDNKMFNKIMKFYRIKNLDSIESYKKICLDTYRLFVYKILKSIMCYAEETNKQDFIHITLFIRKNSVDYYLWINTNMCLVYSYFF